MVKLFVAVDGHPASYAAAHHALFICGRKKDVQCKVTFCHAIDPSITIPAGGAVDGIYVDFLDSLKKEGNAVLNRCAELAKSYSNVEVDTVLAQGNAIQVILEHLKAGKFDMCVVGTHGRKGFQRFLLGSVAESVMREAHVPVIGVRISDEEIDAERSTANEEGAPEAKRARIGSSLEEHMRKGLQWHKHPLIVPFVSNPASEFATRSIDMLRSCLPAMCDVLHPPAVEFVVVDDRDAAHRAKPIDLSPLHVLSSFLRGKVGNGVDVSVRTIEVASDREHPSEVIARQLENAGAALMTTHGRSGIRRLISGSVAEAVLRQAPSCKPVVVVSDISFDWWKNHL